MSCSCANATRLIATLRPIQKRKISRPIFCLPGGDLAKRLTMLLCATIRRLEIRIAILALFKSALRTLAGPCELLLQMPRAAGGMNEG